MDGTGDVHTTGSFDALADFNPGAGINQLNPAGVDDIFVSKLDSNGDFLWARAMGGATNDRANGIAVDSAGNVHTTGYFTGNADFDPASGVEFVLSSPGNDLAFISKLDSNDDFVWAVAVDGDYDAVARSVAVDAVGNVFSTGYFTDQIDFDPGAGTFFLSPVAGEDVFVSKLDSSGALVWAQSLGGPNDDAAYAIAVDAAGGVYTTGYFGDFADFDPGIDTYQISVLGEADIFVSKLSGPPNGAPPNVTTVTPETTGPTNATEMFFTVGFDEIVLNFDAVDVIVTHSGTASTGVTVGGHGGSFDVTVEGISGDGYLTVEVDTGSDIQDLDGNPLASSVVSPPVYFGQTNPEAGGDFVWAGSFVAETEVNGIATDDQGNVYATGTFEGQVDFDPGPGTTYITEFGGVGAFAVKLDSSGAFLWAKAMGGVDRDRSYSLAVDSAGNVYTTGDFTGTADFDPGINTFNLVSTFTNNVFVSRLDSDGNFVWAKSLSGDEGGRGFNIALDGAGNVYTTGDFRGTADFDPGAGAHDITSAGGNDIFVSKLDTNGDFAWALAVGGADSERGDGIAVDSTGDVYVTGEFSGTADFYPGAGSYNLTSNGEDDIFGSSGLRVHLT